MGISNFFKKKPQEVIDVKKFSSEKNADKEILKALKIQGDNPSISRPVRHYCYFRTKEELNKFLNLSRIQQAQKEPLLKGIGIVIIINSTMDEESIFSQIDEIISLTTEAGGQYDGWETSIVKYPF